MKKFRPNQCPDCACNHSNRVCAPFPLATEPSSMFDVHSETNRKCSKFVTKLSDDKNFLQTTSGLIFECVKSMKHTDIDRFHREYISMVRNLNMDEDLKPCHMVHFDNSEALIMR